jgi:alpha-tubulin suppressor-like RCC1 family protein
MKKSYFKGIISAFLERGTLRFFAVAVLCAALASGGIPLGQGPAEVSADSGGGPDTDARVFAAGGITKAEAGYRQAHVLFGDGTLFGWGDGAAVGNGGKSYQNVYAPVTVAKDVADVSSGHGHTLILKNDGTVWGFGYQGYAPLGTNDVKERTYPTKLLLGANAKKIYAGYSQSFIIKSNGDLWAAGYNENGVLGTGSANDEIQKTFKLVGTGFTDVISGGYSVGNLHTFGLKGGDLYAWGGNKDGNLGDGSKVDKTRPIKINFPSGLKVARIIKGCWDTNGAIMSDGSLYIWGESGNYQTGQNSNVGDILSPVKLMDGVKDAAFGNELSLFLKNDGTLHAAGRVTFSGPTYKTPTRIATGVASIAANDNAYYYIKSDGTLWSWGAIDSTGHLGNGSKSDSVSSPVQVATGMKSVFTDNQFDGVAFALKSDGTLTSAGDKRRNGNGKNTINYSFTGITFKESKLYVPDEMKLKSIKLSTGKLSPKFKKDKLSYSAKIAAKKTKVKVTPVKLESGATIQIKSGSKFRTAKSITVKLAKGKSKTIQIKVLGKNGWERTYKLKISRKKK